MTRRLLLGLSLAWIASVLPVSAKDAGRDVVGRAKVEVYFATNGDPAEAGARVVPAPEEVVRRFQAQKALHFSHYRRLGGDVKPIYRSYENWAEPIAGSDEILCRFEVQSRLPEKGLRLDLELWLSRKKILKSGVVLGPSKPVYVLGPEWRGGRLIIAVELVPAAS
ncbi:hypothetical protein HNR46_003790 [Haloferula luteola]|uniref:Uncharacterized protein n=1 Tax=Haloferula luteola TaxID=595692 RepID=A0A840VIB8_9BACT|nr:hypothetical protein [Haloferula luteola]MBB5353529.1 hypothetical protein [Haloferula luteola]